MTDMGHAGESKDPPWTIDDQGLLCWKGADRFSSSYVADLLSGEDEGRITPEDVLDLFNLAHENAVMRAVLADLDTAVRMGGLAGTTTDVAFVWSQNQDALLAGETTWEAQYGPHRSGHFGSNVEQDR